MPTTPIDIENLADNFLTFTNMVTDIFDPTGCNFRNRNEALTAAIFIERDERYKVFDILYGNRQPVPIPVATLCPAWEKSLELEIISALMLAFPPVGSADRARRQRTSRQVLAFSNTVCSFSQSGHFTLKNLLRFSRISRTIIHSLRQLKLCDPVALSQVCLSAGNTTVPHVNLFCGFIATGFVR